MALKQAIQQESGFDATYWRIDKVEVDWRRKRATLRLVGYKDEAARREKPNRAVMDRRQYGITGKEFTRSFGLVSPEQVGAFDSSISYEEGDLCSYNGALYEAAVAVSSGDTGTPDASSKWDAYSPLSASRRMAYRHVTENDIDFVDATKV
jgi:hypothetical protein